MILLIVNVFLKLNGSVVVDFLSSRPSPLKAAIPNLIDSQLGRSKCHFLVKFTIKDNRVTIPERMVTDSDFLN